MKTVSITDYRLKSPTLAKVIISYTGEVDGKFIAASLSKQMGYQATPVEASFKKIKEGVAVGFIRANKEVRSVSKAEVTAKYRVMSSNILMDKEDNSLWDVKEGSAGKYLARHGKEDLTALVEASVQRRSDIPALRHITIAKAATSEVVAFVDDEGDVDHGFAVATSDDKVEVLSFNRRIPVTVDYDSVISISPVQIKAALHKEVLASLSPEQKKQSKEYYSALYGYAPEYLRQINKMIDEGTVA
jgi:hypothetical protein